MQCCDGRQRRQVGFVLSHFFQHLALKALTELRLRLLLLGMGLPPL